MKLKISIRFRIVALISAALVISLAAYLYVGNSLIVQDKISYIYEYSLTQVNSVGASIEGRISRAATVAQAMSGSWMRDESSADIFQKDELSELGIDAVLLLKADADGRFRVGKAHGARTSAARSVLDKLGWTRDSFAKQPVSVAQASPGVLALGGTVSATTGESVSYLTLVRLEDKLLESVGRDFEIHVLDSAGQGVLSRAAAAGRIAETRFDEVEIPLLKGAFPAGVQDWAPKSAEYMVGYKRLFSNQVLVTSYIPRELAFAAAKALVRRSVALGISILILALGATLVFVSGLTTRLRALWHATQFISRGDFSVKLDTDVRVEDEVSSLSGSFNMMSDRIQDLLVATAGKARMEKELETAQEVQARFFPAERFRSSQLELSGKLVPASECGGDWWHYCQLGDHLLVVLGDVTGHGVQAALVTAAVHGAFSLLMERLKSLHTETAHEARFAEAALRAVGRDLNTAVYFSAHGKSHMTFVASMINLRTGELSMFNAAHPAPFHLSQEKAKGKASSRQRVQSLMVKPSSPLGRSKDIEIQVQKFQLGAGDALFWYTDGFLDARPSDDAKVSKVQFVELLDGFISANPGDAERISESMISEGMRFFGADAKERPDDMTSLCAVVPANAVFAEAVQDRSEPSLRALDKSPAAPEAVPVEAEAAIEADLADLGLGDEFLAQLGIKKDAA